MSDFETIKSSSANSPLENPEQTLQHTVKKSTVSGTSEGTNGKVSSVRSQLETFFQDGLSPSGQSFSAINISRKQVGKTLDNIKQVNTILERYPSVKISPELRKLVSEMSEFSLEETVEVFSKPENLYLEASEGNYVAVKDTKPEIVIDPTKVVAIQGGKVFGHEATVQAAVKAFNKNPPPNMVAPNGQPIVTFVAQAIPAAVFTQIISKVIEKTISDFRISISRNETKEKSSAMPTPVRNENQSKEAPEIEATGSHMEPTLIIEKAETLTMNVSASLLILNKARAEAREQEKEKKAEEEKQAIIMEGLEKYEIKKDLVKEDDLKAETTKSEIAGHIKESVGEDLESGHEINPNSL